MVVTLYKTKITKEPRWVSNDIENYLTSCESITIDVPAFIPTAITFLTLAADDTYNYIRTEWGDKVYYFFARPTRITPTATTYNVEIDWMSYTIGNGIPVTLDGRIIRAQDMVDHADRFYMPDTPVADVCVETSEVFDYVCATASYIIKDGDTERAAIAFAPPTTFDNDAVLSGHIGNLARAKTLGNKEILNVVGMWLLPPQFLWPKYEQNGIPNPNSSVGSGLGSLDVYWHTDTVEYGKNMASRTGTSTPDGDIIAAERWGNFGTSIDIPFTGVWSRQMGLMSYMDSDHGAISVKIRYGDVDVDLLPSLSLPVSATRTTQPATTRMVNDTISALGGVLAIAGGAATMNPLMIGGGAVALGGTIANAATRINYRVSQTNGDAYTNQRYNLSKYEHHVFYSNACCVMTYTAANHDAIKAELDLRGYVGDVIKWEFNPFSIPPRRYREDLSDPTNPITGEWLWRGVYRQFADVHVTADVPDECRKAIKETAEAGFTLYDDRADVNYGTHINCPINFWCWDIPKPW